MATISVKNLSYAIYEASKGKEGGDLDFVIKNIINLIDKKQMLSKTDKILKKLEDIIDQENKILKMKISSRKKIPDKLEKEIENYIKNRYKVEKVDIKTEENEKLLGGIKIEVKDEILDTTLLSKVHKLQTYLTEN